ncbi:MAG: CYTH domain-containing protein [candidate division Zixibacteria bacterium]|nr:CYTH domain-containing protein [candidate division Zixibacteria bacterium]
MNSKNQLQREIEVKLDLESFTNYLKFVGFIGQLDNEVRQVNCFFDTEDGVLSGSGWALRVRTEAQTGLVTLKGDNSGSDKVAIRDEIEASIPFEIAGDVIALKHDILDLDIAPIVYVKEKFGQISLARLVRFENHRQRKEFQLGDHTYTLEVDTTTYSDGSVGYELEVELPDEDRLDGVLNDLRRMFSSLSIPFTHQTTSKFARALKRVGEF